MTDVHDLLIDLRERNLARAANEDGRADGSPGSVGMSAGRQQAYEWNAEQLGSILEGLRPVLSDTGLDVSHQVVVPPAQEFARQVHDFMASCAWEVEPLELMGFIAGWTARESTLDAEPPPELAQALSRLHRSLAGAVEEAGADEPRAETDTPSVGRWTWEPHMLTPKVPTDGVLPNGTVVELRNVPQDADPEAEGQRYVQVDGHWYRLISGHPGHGPVVICVDLERMPALTAADDVLVLGSILQRFYYANDADRDSPISEERLGVITNPFDPSGRQYVSLAADTPLVPS